tara:strand:- start:988 stop:2223 length:1236 start_codon:yes stop_codon:yes gene_type:complete
MRYNKQILNDALYYFFSKLFPGIFGLLFIFIFTRLIGIVEYGQYSLLHSKINLIISFGFGWLNQSTLRYGNILKEKNNHITFLTICILIISLVTIVLKIIEGFTYNDFLLILFCIASMGCLSFFKTFYQSKLLPRSVFLLVNIQSFFSLLLPLFFFANGILSSKILLFCVGLSSLISIYIVLLLKKELSLFNSFNYKIKKNQIKKWLKFGVPVSIWSCMGLLLPYLDRFYINKFLNPELLGAYSSINELTLRTFSFIIFPFTMALHPRIVKLWNINKKIESFLVVVKSVKAVIAFLLICLVILFFFDNEIFIVIKYIIPSLPEEAKKIITPLISAGIIWQLSFFTHKMIELNEKTYLMIFFITISILINIVGNNIYILKYGIVATSYLSLLSALSYCLLTIIYFFYSKKFL